MSTTPPPPPDLEAAFVTIDGRTFAVVSHAIGTGVAVVPDAISGLPAALAHVARLALDGLDNAAIAAVRRTSVRTVAKQLETVYRRLGIGSRIELAALCAPSVAGGKNR